MNMRKQTWKAAVSAAAICVAAAFPSWAATWLDGASGNMSDSANWNGGTVVAANGAITFSNTGGSVSYVTNDLSYKFADTTVVDGSWEFAGTQTFYPGNALLMGNQSKKVSIVNYANWDCAYYFAIANYSSSTVVFTNRAGNITCRANGTDSKMPGVTVGGRYNQEDNYTGTSGTFVFEGGTLTAVKSFEVGYGKNCTGVLIQTGGTITADRLGIANTVQKGTGSRGTVILKGGTFATQRIAIGNGTGGTVTFDGGTLKLTASNATAIPNSSKLAVKVGSGGGTILLANGVASTIPANISSALESPAQDGGLTVKGKGRLAFTGTLSYTGATTVELGATMIVPSPSTIPGAFVVTIPATPPDDGVYTLLTTTGADTLETFFASATLPTGDPQAVFRLSADKKSIICLYGDVEQTWVGGASGDLGDATKWSTGLVPTHGNAVITSGSAATLTSNAAFTPDAITFPADSALITINGEDAIANLLAVTNNAALHHVFNCPVSFKANEDADICASSGSGTYVKYLGGMTMYKPKKAASNVDVYLSGQITLTAEIADWSAYVTIDRLHLVDSGSKLTIPNSVTIKTATPNFTLASGTTLEVQGNMAVTASNGYFSYANAGRMLVSGIVSSSATTWPGAGSGTASGVLSARGFSTSGGNGIVFHPKDVSGATLVIGSDGLGGTGNYYVQKSLSSTLKPSADYAINAPISSAGGSYNPTLTIGTSDYFDSAVGRTITVNKVIGTRYLLNVNGNGMILFNSVSTFARGISVQNSATLAVNPGMRPGNGTVTMGGTSTLKVAQSGTVTLAGNLSLGSTAALAFNFTANKTAPKLAINAASTIPATVNVKISANEGIRPSSSQTHTLTSTYNFTGKTVNLVDQPDWVKSVDVVDGNLVLTAKPKGFMLIVK